MSASPIRNVGSFALAPLILGLLGGGCVPTSLELAPDHPARPTDPVTSPAEPAALLRSGVDLYASPGSNPAPEMALHSTEPAAQEVTQAEADGSREAPFVGRGVVQRISASRMEIQHGDIPGFMPAMTMSFPISSDLEGDAIEVGDEIIFSIEFASGGHQVFRVEEITDDPTVDSMDRDDDAPTSEPEG